MSKIQTFLQNILSARYGKDVRQSIHDAIEEVDKVADTAKDSATAQAEAARKSAQTSALNAQASATSEANAKTYMETAGSSEINAKASETNAKASENSAKESENIAKLTEERAREVFESIPEDYSTISNDLYELAIKETASGEEIHVNNSSNLKLREFALYGKATQDGTPTPENPVDIVVAGESYNLLENTATSQTINGVEFVVNEDKSVTVNGTATANATYVLQTNHKLSSGEFIMSGCPSGGSENTFFLQYSSNVDIAYSDIGSGVKIKEMDFSKYPNVDVKIQIRSGYTAENLTFYPMIRKATVKNNRYMPYGVGSVEVESVGKNLCGKLTNEVLNSNTGKVDRTDSNFICCGYFPVKANTPYRASINGTLLWCRMFYYDKDKNFIGSELKTEHTTPNDARFARMHTGDYSGDFTLKFQIEEGTEVTPFEPYKETTSTIQGEYAGIPVSSGGNYTDQSGQQWICDEVVKYADGSGERVQRVGKVVFDGDENFSSSSLVSGRYVFGLANAKPEQSPICNLFRCPGEDKKELNACYIDGNRTFFVNTSFNTVNELKEYLTSNNMIVLYELGTPIRTPLTAEQIAEIEKVHTFYPVTNISNDFDCGMKVTYLADSKNYIDNQLALQAQAREQEMMAMFMLLPEETQAAMIENDINNLLTESEV